MSTNESSGMSPGQASMFVKTAIMVEMNRQGKYPNTVPGDVENDAFCPACKKIECICEPPEVLR
jgi:hypothetical protein